MRLKYKKKVDKNTLIKWMVLSTIPFALSLLKPLGEILVIFSTDSVTRIYTLLMCIFSILLIGRKGKLKADFSFKLSLYVFFIVLIRFFADALRGRNLYEELAYHSAYFYVLLAIPIVYLLKSQIIELEKMIDIIIFCTVLSYLLRMFISFYYTLTRIQILKSISLEAASEGWIRNDTLRINPPCFGMIIIALCMYRFYSEKKIKKRVWFLCAIVLALYYSAFIHCARSLVVYQILEIAFLIFVKKESGIKQIVLFFGAIVALVILFNVGAFDMLLGIFSTNNVSYGLSNLSRFIAYPYYFFMFVSKLWTGSGFLVGSELYERSNNITVTLGDVGLLRSLVFMGVWIIPFYLVLCWKGFSAGLRSMEIDRSNNLNLLAWGCAFCLIITCVNIDCFFSIFVYTVPYCIAFIDYIGYANKCGITKTMGAR